MPELPEVETIKRELEQQVVGKRIVKTEILLPRMVRKQGSPEEVKQKVRGRAVERVQRRGKYLLFYIDSDDILVLHLGMTGQLLFSTPKFPFEVDKYTHIIFHFDGADQLLLRDTRQFGQIFISNKKELEDDLDLGPEPLSSAFTETELQHILNRPTKIKPLLMDQQEIAGIGNIYSDEILYEARIHPLRPANSLSPSETHRLFLAIQDVLEEGIRLRGTSVNSYVDTLGRKGTMQSKHRVYRKEGEPCPQCGEIVQRIKIGGRSSYFCPKCQK